MAMMKLATGFDFAETKVRKVGNSIGVIIPTSVLRESHLKDGDDVKLFVDETGTVTIEKSDEDFDLFMKALDFAEVRYEKTLEKLAK